MADIILQPGSPPEDAPMPTTPQMLVNFIAAYLSLTGLQTLEGVIIDTAEPAPEDRDKLWVKVDAATNRPIGVMAFRGEWQRLPVIPNTGTTLERPGNPQTGEQYWDEDINCLLVYERGAWRTASGSPGDIKFVSTSTIEEALELNPGWSELDEARGRVLVGAGAGDGGLTERAKGATWGEETTLLTTANIPPHSHTVTLASGSNNNTGAFFDTGATADGTPVVIESSSVGNGESFTNCPPSLAMWCLVKD